jgi:hypothetical protein
MIVKKGNKFVVKDSKGEKVLGTHSTKKAALRQLAVTESAVVKLSINTAAAAPGTASSATIPEGNWEVFDCVAVLTSAASTNADLTVKVGGSDCFDGPVIGDGSALANMYLSTLGQQSKPSVSILLVMFMFIFAEYNYE